MAQIISIVNQKGGVGKTTTAINLAAYLALKGKFVLLVDMDPQCNATSGLGLESDKGIYNVLIDNYSLDEVILSSKISGLKIVPATEALAGAGVELVNLDNREFKLQEAFLAVRNNFDYIIIDCPPSLGLLTVNCLLASDGLLIPVQAEYYALEGLSKLLNTINLIQENIKTDLQVLGAVVTMFDRRNRLSEQVMQELRNHFPHKLFNTVIPRNVRLTEAPSHGLAISEYDPLSKGALAYENLAQEILNLTN